MTGKLTAQLNGLFYGWRMVAAGCAMRMLGGGFHLYGFTIFFLPITNELGLSRAATSLVFSLARAEGAIEGPLAGYFIDRYGPRPMMLAGIILSGLGYMLLATVESYAAFLIVYLGVISLAFSAGFMHSPMVLANSWFIRRRAMAMTLISSAIGIGGTLITPILAFTVSQWGWRYGAFVAGLLLAETEYRRAIEAIVEPIKSLLLGVFFFSVGLSLDPAVLVANPLNIFGMTALLLVLQALIIFGLCRWFGVSKPASIETAALLAPGGEFAFIVLTLALSYGLVSATHTSMLLTSVSLTMALIPTIGAFGRRLAKASAPPTAVDPELSALPPGDGEIKALVVGYGRVGQLIGDMLEEHKVPYIAVEREPHLVSEARTAKKPVYYGDVRQMELLARCGLDTAKAASLLLANGGSMADYRGRQSAARACRV